MANAAHPADYSISCGHPVAEPGKFLEVTSGMERRVPGTTKWSRRRRPRRIFMIALEQKYLGWTECDEESLTECNHLFKE